jgi:carbonic anhydrase
MTDRRALAALQSLKDGNRRFVEGTLARITDHDDALRQDLSTGQSPIAVVVSCSDSRVAPSVVFDQRLGDLFTIRVAGNVTPLEVVGSIEYAVSQLGTRLVVVVGHTGCGAVAATLDEIERPSGALTPALQALIDRIRPAVEHARAGAPPEASIQGPARRRVLDEAMRENVLVAVRGLGVDSLLLERMVREDGLMIVGAEYSLETGVVDFLE